MYSFNKNKRASEERIARLIDLHAPGIWDWEVSSNRFVVTDRLRDIFGLSAAVPVVLDDLLKQTHPDDRIWVTPMRSSSLGTTYPLAVKYRVYRPDGEMR